MLFRSLLREAEVSDNDDDMAEAGLDVPDDPQRPWRSDYCAYMDTMEQVPGDWGVIQWWGIRLSVSNLMSNEILT